MKPRRLLPGIFLGTIGGLALCATLFGLPALLTASAHQLTFISTLIAPAREAGIPVHLNIPRLNIDAPIEQVGLTPTGAMENPTSYWTAGWYKLGARPGEKGNTVLAGHLDTETGPAIFWPLTNLGKGSLIEITDDRGETHTFTVTEIKRFEDGKAPMEELFGPSSKRLLRLITCIGTWNERTKEYSQRLIVTAELAIGD